MISEGPFSRRGQLRSPTVTRQGQSLWVGRPKASTPRGPQPSRSKLLRRPWAIALPRASSRVRQKVASRRGRRGATGEAGGSRPRPCARNSLPTPSGDAHMCDPCLRKVRPCPISGRGPASRLGVRDLSIRCARQRGLARITHRQGRGCSTATAARCDSGCGSTTSSRTPQPSAAAPPSTNAEGRAPAPHPPAEGSRRGGRRPLARPRQRAPAGIH
jgi:hypothetical protein